MRNRRCRERRRWTRAGLRRLRECKPRKKVPNECCCRGGEALRRSARRSPGGATLGQEVGRDARRQTAAILEGLAGVRTPTEAAEALGMSLPRYCQVESRAFRGLVATCQARPKGRQRSVENE